MEIEYDKFMSLLEKTSVRNVTTTIQKVEVLQKTVRVARLKRVLNV